MFIFKKVLLLFLGRGKLINNKINQFNSFSYLERYRDWPNDTSATAIIGKVLIPASLCNDLGDEEKTYL